MFNILAQFNHKAEIRESKDEILIGELVAAMLELVAAVLAGSDGEISKFRDCGSIGE